MSDKLKFCLVMVIGGCFSALIVMESWWLFVFMVLFVWMIERWK